MCVCVLSVCMGVFSTLKNLFFKLFQILCNFIEQLPGSVLVKTKLKYIL